MSVVEALKSSSKGQLKYGMKQMFIEVSPPPLSRHHEEKQYSKQNASFGVSPDTDDIDSAVNLTNTVTGHKVDMDLPNSLFLMTLKVSDDSGGKDKGTKNSGTTCHEKRYMQADSPQENNLVVPPDWWRSKQALEESDELLGSKVQISLMQRSKLYNNHNRTLTHLMKNKQKDAIKHIENVKASREMDIDRIQLAEQKEAKKKLESLKQSHEKHKEKIDTKQKEIEQKRLDLEREEKRRHEELKKRLQKLQSLQTDVENNKSKFNELLDSFQHKQLLPETVAKFKAVLDKVCSGLLTKVQKAQSEGVSNEILEEFQGDCEKSQYAVQFLQKQIEEVEKKLKADEAKKKEAEAKQAEDQRKAENAKKLQAEIAQDFRVQALTTVHKEQKSRADLLTQAENSIQSFVKNSQMKQYRFDLQRAVNTPINAISGVDMNHLRDKLHKLLVLLRGQDVTTSNRRVKISGSEALLFCQNLVAKMLVRKGEEQVSSLHESAFSVAAVILGLWSEFPQVGQLFMAHLQASCPYICPYYPPRKEGESNEDYHKSLGYKVDDDGNIEEQDKFLRRMSGLMRLYCACLVTSVPPTGGPRIHPQGLEHAWAWLARTLDQSPTPDVTATLIYDVLCTTGSALLRRYGPQVVKLVRVLYLHFLPKLKEVAVTSAALGRLQSFLQTALNSGRFPEPAGVLPQEFWGS